MPTRAVISAMNSIFWHKSLLVPARSMKYSFGSQSGISAQNIPVLGWHKSLLVHARRMEIHFRVELKVI